MSEEERKDEIISIKMEEEGEEDTEIKIENPIDWKTENELYSKYDFSQPIGGQKFSLYQVLRNFLSQFKSAEQAYRISIPVCLLQPMSFLERLSIHCTPTNFLGTFQNLQEGERFLRILQWELTTWSKVNREGIEQAKPYNPILGEFFSCRWDHKLKRDRSSTFFLAEQVSHHPPVSSFHCENQHRQIVFRGTVFPSMSVGWNSITLKIVGDTTLELKKFGEVYHISYPSICAANLIKGAQRLEAYDKLIIECEKTKWKAEIDIKYGKEGYMEGPVSQDGEVAFLVSGHLDKKIFMTMVDESIPEDEEPQKIVLVDFSRLNKRDKKVVKPLGVMKNNESRRVWHDLTKRIVEEDLERGEISKSEIEEEQRRKKRERISKNEDFEPAYFSPTGKKKLEEDVKVIEGDVEALETTWEIKKEARDMLLSGKI